MRTGILERLLGRRSTGPAGPSAARSLPDGDPENPLTEKLVARRRFAEALQALVGGKSPKDALDSIDRLTRSHPGIAPEGDIASHAVALRAAAKALPANLTVRASLAAALDATGQAEEARTLAISVIRESRTTDVGHPSTVSADRFRTAIPKPGLFHSVDLGDDFVDGDFKSAVITARETLMAHWPDLSGKSVLDVGSFDGWFAFEAERRGAASVTANDYYSWMIDFPRAWAWIGGEAEEGRSANPYTAPYPINDPDTLPGKKIYDMTHAALGSRVRSVFGPFEHADLAPHDIVLLLGVIYHTEDPMNTLRRAYQLTKETLIIETMSFEYVGQLAEPIWRFYRDGVRGDITTVWVPSSIGLRDALYKVGFKHVELLYGWDGSGYASDWNAMEARLWVHAHR